MTTPFFFRLQVNIQSSQLQQNVEGTLVNVNAGNEGVVIVNTNDPETGLVSKSAVGPSQFGAEAPVGVQCRGRPSLIQGSAKCRVGSSRCWRTWLNIAKGRTRSAISADREGGGHEAHLKVLVDFAS